MSPKSKETPIKHNLHTHHLVKVKKQNRLLMTVFIVTGVVIVGLVGFAVLRTTLFKNVIPVATVNGQNIDNEYFKERVRWERNYSLEQYRLLTSNPQLAEAYQTQITQIESLLNDPQLFGQYVLNAITQDELIAMKGKEMGVEVSEQEIDTFIEQFFNYYPEGTPTPASIPTAFPAPAISKTQEAILGETEAAALAAERENTIEPTIQPTATLAADATPQPTATAFTEDTFKDVFGTYMDNLRSVNVSEKYLRKIFYHYLMNQKVTDAVIADVPREAEQVWARHILVKTEEEAKAVNTRLITEEWAAVASEVSLDNSNKDEGGDLGWFAHDQMVAEFEDAAFTLEIGEISAPVETQFGWHIIQLVDKAILPLNEVDYQTAQSIYYNNWITEVTDSAEIKTNDIWKDIVPTEPSIS